MALTVSAVSPAVLADETLATQQTETSARENMQKILESVKQRVEIPSECSEFFEQNRGTVRRKKFITLHGMKKTETRVLI